MSVFLFHPHYEGLLLEKYQDYSCRTLIFAVILCVLRTNITKFITKRTTHTSKTIIMSSNDNRILSISW